MSVISSIHDIWKRKSLISIFAITDLKLKYRNSILGFFWSILEPLFILAVLYVVFTHIFKSQIENYPIYLFLGIIMWGMFNRGTSLGLSSVLVKGGILTKIYFPREIPAISSTITSFLLMCLEFVVFTAFIIVLQFVPPITIIFLPLILIALFILSLGVSLPLSALNVYVRDIQYVWSVLMFAGFFAMPIIYSYEILPTWLNESLSLIPTAKILNMAHDVTIYGIFPQLLDWVYIFGTSFGILALGYAIFKKLEKKLIEHL